LGAYLDHAWPFSAGDGQEGTEVKIMGKDDVNVVPRPIHDDVIWCAWVTHS